MATTSTTYYEKEKQKKAAGMYIYNLATGGGGGGHSKPEANNPPPVSLKKAISRGWGQLRRSKTYREVDHRGGELMTKVVEGGEDKQMIIDHRPGRKSAACSSEALSSLSRKSVSSQIEEIKMVEGRKSVCSIISEQVSSRESVSQIEEIKMVEGRRRSVCGGVSEFEVSSRKSSSEKHVAEVVNVATVAALLQVKVLVTDMPGFMQLHAFRCARKSFDALEKFSSRDMACTMKKEFDKVYGPAWHCIVGSSFGSYVTHSTGCFLYFSMEKLYILVFKTKVQRATS